MTEFLSIDALGTEWFGKQMEKSKAQIDVRLKNIERIGSSM